MYINATGINTVAASIMPRKPRLTIRKKKQGKIPVSQPVAVGIPSESGKLGVDNQKAVTSGEVGTTTVHHNRWYQQQTGNVLYLWKIGFSHLLSGDNIPCFVKQVVMVDLSNGGWRFWVNGKPVSTSSCAVLENVPEKEPDLDDLLKVIDESKRCPGITKKELVDYANSVKTLSKLVDGNYGQATVRHEQYEQLMGHSKRTRCKHCNTLRIRLTVQLLRFTRWKQQQQYSKHTPNVYLNTPQKMDKLKGLSQSLKVTQHELKSSRISMYAQASSLSIFLYLCRSLKGMYPAT